MNIHDEYIQKVKCKAAIDEIANKKIDLIKVGRWLYKHEDLFSEVVNDIEPSGLPPLEFEEAQFYESYTKLNKLSEYSENEEQAWKAMEEYENIKNNDEYSLLQWIYNYLDIGTKLLFFEMEYFGENETMYDVIKIRISNSQVLKLWTSDFEYIIKFQKIFSTHYWPLMERNKINSDLRIDEIRYSIRVLLLEKFNLNLF